MTRSSRRLFAATALLDTGWAADVAVTVGDDGRIAAVEPDAAAAPGDERIAGPLLPALPNLHSHAVQRAMAGLAEVAGAGEDSFWTWRDLMYRLNAGVTPDDVEAVAAKLYIEMLKGGFGHVAEFHYLHHGQGGAPYADPAEMSRRILAAARTAGIGLTLLPVFYAHSDFGGAPPNEGQARFVHDVDGFLALLAAIAPACREQEAVAGLAIHSLRAATAAEMRAVLDGAATGGPIHIHVAEQQREVDACLAWSRRRPVEWLLDAMPVDGRWCAVHATHMMPQETAALAASGAVAGLCPHTEANLGDGLFPAVAYRAAGGRFGIGTDSHVSTDAAAELRLLEYGQRLRDKARNRLAAEPGASVGRTLFDGALAGGARACGLTPPGLRPGARADLIVLDARSPFIAAARGDAIIDRWVFALGDHAVRDVMVAGRWAVRDRRHAAEDAVDHAFRHVLAKLTSL